MLDTGMSTTVPYCDNQKLLVFKFISKIHICPLSSDVIPQVFVKFSSITLAVKKIMSKLKLSLSV